MPLYDYCCADCGPFDAFRPMAECRAPTACPDCGRSAPRMVGGAPAISVISQAMRRAHALNEKSADAPRTSRAGHGVNCACCSGGTQASRTRRTPDGWKTFQKGRPWMISH